MPVRSEAQRRFMFATADGKTNVAPSIGKEFVATSRGVTNLPKRAKRLDSKPRRLIVKRKNGR